MDPILVIGFCLFVSYLVVTLCFLLPMSGLSGSGRKNVLGEDNLILFIVPGGRMFNH